MPAIMTHNIFGREALELLPKDILKTDEERTAFILGNQGPDPLFFRSLGTPYQIETAHRLATDLHDQHMSESLTWLRRSVEHLPEKDAGVGRAFALGYLAHYTLDSTTHPFIFAQQYAIQAEDPTLMNAGGPVHAVIEADIDSVLLREKLNLSPFEYPSQDLIISTSHITEVAGALLSQVILGTFGMVFPISEYASSVRDMKFVYRTMEPIGNPQSEAVRCVQSMLHDYSQIQGLCHREFKEDEWPWFNKEHHSWTNPFTNETSTMSFMDLYNLAQEKWEKFAVDYINKEDCSKITKHLNFSGEELNEQEVYVD